VDAAEEDALLADVRLVGADGRVGRDEQGVVAGGDKGRHERVVVHARAAEHARGAGGDVGDAHGGPYVTSRGLPAFAPVGASTSVDGAGKKKLARNPTANTRHPVTPAAKATFSNGLLPTVIRGAIMLVVKNAADVPIILPPTLVAKAPPVPR